MYGGTAKSLFRTLNVGWFRNWPVGEYSRRMTSGVSTSKRASPSTTVAPCAALPAAMLILVDRFTGEVSVVAGPLARAADAAGTVVAPSANVPRMTASPAGRRRIARGRLIDPPGS